MWNSIKKWFCHLIQTNRDIYSEQEAPVMNRAERRKREREQAKKAKRY